MKSKIKFPYSLPWKICLLGDGFVGKTCISRNLLLEEFEENYDMTIGANFFTGNLKINGSSLKIVLWDLSGQERFEEVRAPFYLGTRAALLVFDITCRGSFFDIKHWLRELRSKAPESSFIIVGNKVDMRKEREVSKEEGKKLAKNLGTTYIETSAKTGENVKKSFEIAIMKAMKKESLSPLMRIH